MPLNATSSPPAPPKRNFIKKLLPFMGLFGLLVCFNLVYNINPFSGIQWSDLLPAPELFLLFLLLCLTIDLNLRLPVLFWGAILTTLWFLRIFGLADQAMPYYFDRQFNLYIDTGYALDLLDLFYLTTSLGGFLLTILLSISTVVGFVYLSWRGLFKLKKLLHEVTLRRSVLALLLLLAFSGFVVTKMSTQQRMLSISGYLPRFSEEVRFISEVQKIGREFNAELEAVRFEAAKLPQDLVGLNESNVLLFFVESYGHSSLTHAEYGPLVQPALQEMQTSLGAAGFEMVSSYMGSPTYGGTSWLAHGAFSSGVAVHDQLRFDMLLKSDVKALPRYFDHAGYRTICVMPGTRYAWPEGAWFGYQEKIFADDFAYAGPTYGWSPMPDQFVIDRVHRKHLAESPSPIFAEFVLVSSHAPFHIQPPYVVDWSRIGNGAIYDDLQPLRYNIEWPKMENAAEGYSRSISYVLKSLEEYLLQFIDDNSLIIILGDHQPNLALTGPNQPWSVPIHVISRNTELLKPFRARDYISGMIPNQQWPHPGMESFLPNFLLDFSGSNRLAD
ncbi:MAG: sulfatase-like hydrolase/transferase [Calditrichia bacterium]